MKYIVIEEFPEGNFNIPYIDDNEQAIFEDLDKAIVFSEELQTSYILPLNSVAKYSVLGIKEIERLYKTVADKVGISFDEFKSSRISLIMLAKHSLRYYLYEYCNMTYHDIAMVERLIFNTGQAQHTTIMNSVYKVKDDPIRHRDFVSYIRSL